MHQKTSCKIVIKLSVKAFNDTAARKVSSGPCWSLPLCCICHHPPMSTRSTRRYDCNASNTITNVGNHGKTSLKTAAGHHIPNAGDTGITTWYLYIITNQVARLFHRELSTSTREYLGSTTIDTLCSTNWILQTNLPVEEEHNKMVGHNNATNVAF